MQNSMNRILPSVILLITTVVFIATSIQVRSAYKPVYLWMEAEDATVIESPFEKSRGEEDISGGEFLQIKQGMGGGVLNKAGGKAHYQMNIAKPGNYVLWARVKWNDGCGNSLFVTIGDESNKSLIGQDGIYDRWHWVKHPILYSLEKQKLQISFSNSEDGIFLDKILLTNNMDYRPEGVHQGGFQTDFSVGAGSNWVPSTPDRWSVKEDSVTQNPVFVLTPSDIPMNENILSSESTVDSNFAIAAKLKTFQINPDRRHYRIILNYQDKDNYYSVDLKSESCQIIKHRNGSDITLAETVNKNLLNDTEYHDVFVERTPKSIIVKYDNSELLSAIDSEFEQGYLGIGSKYGGLFLETVRYTKLEDIYYSSNFYVLDNKTTFTDEWHPESGLWCRSQLFEPSFPYGVRADSEAVSITGESYWRNYSFRAALKSPTNAGLGLCFYYRNRLNHYLLRLAAVESPKSYANKIQLLKVIDGNKSLLGEAPVNIIGNQWYDVKVAVIDHEIRAYVDNKNVLSLKDSTLSQGKIGLYVDPALSVRPPRPIAALIDAGNMDFLKITLPAEPQSDGIGIVFLYHDDKNYYLFKYNSDSEENLSANKYQLFQLNNGREILLAEKRTKPYTINHQYRFEFLARSNKIITTVNNKMVFDVNVQKIDLGRAGVYVGRDVEDAYFDDVEAQSIYAFPDSKKDPSVASLGDSIPKPTYQYKFGKPRFASRDLCGWLRSSGSWIISRVSNSLIGKKESEKDALNWHKYPIIDNDVDISAGLRIEASSIPFFIICDRPENMEFGYRFTWERDDTKLFCQLQRNGKTVAAKTTTVVVNQVWIPIKIHREGKLIQMSVGDELTIDHRDETIVRANKIGIGVGGALSAAAYFKNIIIQ